MIGDSAVLYRGKGFKIPIFRIYIFINEMVMAS